MSELKFPGKNKYHKGVAISIWNKVLLKVKIPQKVEKMFCKITDTLLRV